MEKFWISMGKILIRIKNILKCWNYIKRIEKTKKKTICYWNESIISPDRNISSRFNHYCLRLSQEYRDGFRPPFNGTLVMGPLGWSSAYWRFLSNWNKNYLIINLTENWASRYKIECGTTMCQQWRSLIVHGPWWITCVAIVERHKCASSIASVSE